MKLHSFEVRVCITLLPHIAWGGDGVWSDSEMVVSMGKPKWRNCSSSSSPATDLSSSYAKTGTENWSLMPTV